MTKRQLLDKVWDLIDDTKNEEVLEWNSVEGWIEFCEELKKDVEQREHNLKVFNEIRGKQND